MFYAGDGVSDLSAAKETDLLFAKQGRGKPNPSSPLNRMSNKVLRSSQYADKDIDLIQYCIRENIPYREFEDWSEILSTLKDIIAGKTDVKHVAVAGARKARHGK
jgi:2-hydroxy-3-keto-5-methylthiopentenyl-1-phosphate phosphatase